MASQSPVKKYKNFKIWQPAAHKLFDSGYMTITPALKVEVSKRIREEFENGREYYQYHGRSLAYLPTRSSDVPQEQYIQWHNENVYKT